ncbi:MAG: bifunctional 4-hydroxy-3-methylbut-2-enyl diphosphate reductase/30S ribosomal protein S1 [Lachnospiraceae bacterium]|nr:bifunctional 4-hydroxy-3-methylbut-2-enyl diphosphate reductase/30S ribosomal protein S1 [Lachnospiraceae bacterium]
MSAPGGAQSKRTVIVAKTAGFCFGVQRAVDTVYRLSEGEHGPVYTFGPIIHNEDVVDSLARRGVRVIGSIEEAEEITEGTIVIRSHGIPKDVDERLRAASEASGGKLRIEDATCPFVKKIHRIVSEHSRAGESIIICGDAKHPEVQGIMGWCEGGATVIATAEEALNTAENAAKEGRKICIVAQTTFNYTKFKDFVDIFQKMGYNAEDSAISTICNATEERQTEARSLARQCDAMLVIGSANSSNTRKLYEIAAQECKNTRYIQSAADLEKEPLPSFRYVGITAGASTPRNIIEEVHAIMDNENFEQLLEESFKTIRNGEVVEGTVIGVKEDEIALNIGYKADGIITKNEYSSQPVADLRTVVKEGDVLTAKVVKVNDGEGQVLLSRRKLNSERASAVLQEAFEQGTVLTAKVTNVVNGGLNVVVDDCRVFIPASLVSDIYEKDLAKFQDQDIEFRITEYNPKKRRIIGNRRDLLLERKKERTEALLSQLQIGDVLEGTVRNVTDFGAFVDIGGVDGLLHVSEVSWGRNDNPKKLFKTGDTVTVFVKAINGEKISLSMKFADQNPWKDAEERFAPGTIVTGRVARMAAFGAFVEIAPGVDALLHVSQISRKRVEKPADVLTVGQEIEAKIVEFKPEEKKISLSMKAIESDEADFEEAVPVEAAPAEEAAAEAPVEEPVAEEVAAEEPKTDTEA